MKMVSDTGITQTISEPEAVVDSAKAGIRFSSIKLHNAPPALDSLSSPSPPKEGEIDDTPGPITTTTAENDEKVYQPKGLNFALLYTCILLGNFLVGYVSAAQSSRSHMKAKAHL